MNAAAVVKLMNKAIKRAGSQSQWARDCGEARQTIGAVLLGQREPSPRILDALGLEKAPTQFRWKMEK